MIRQTLLERLIGGRRRIYRAPLYTNRMTPVYTDTHLVEVGYDWPVSGDCQVLDWPPGMLEGFRRSAWYDAWCDKLAMVLLKKGYHVTAYHYKSVTDYRGVWVPKNVVEYVEASHFRVVPVLGILPKSDEGLANVLVGWLGGLEKRSQSLRIACTPLDVAEPTLIRQLPLKIDPRAKRPRQRTAKTTKERLSQARRSVMGFPKHSKKEKVHATTNSAV